MEVKVFLIGIYLSLIISLISWFSDFNRISLYGRHVIHHIMSIMPTYFKTLYRCYIYLISMIALILVFLALVALLLLHYLPLKFILGTITAMFKVIAVMHKFYYFEYLLIENKSFAPSAGFLKILVL